VKDLIDYQEGRSEIPDCQVGKGEERRLSESLMNSAESSYQQGELMEEDQKCILIIGGIKIFLPSSQAEASVCVADAQRETQPIMTVIKEEKEQILKFAPAEEEEHTVELLTLWETKLKLLEDWLNNPEPEDGCQKTVMQIEGEEHSAKLLRNFNQEVEQEMTAALKPAAEEETYQHEEQLEEAGVEPFNYLKMVADKEINRSDEFGRERNDTLDQRPETWRVETKTTKQLDEALNLKEDAIKRK
jgi:hypothetical protein